MSDHSSFGAAIRRFAWNLRLWAFGAIALASLAACGASDPSSGASSTGAAQPEAQPQVSAAATGAPASPTDQPAPQERPTVPPAATTVSTAPPPTASPAATPPPAAPVPTGMPTPGFKPPKPPVQPQAPRPTMPSAPTVAVTALAASASGWQIYHSDQGGYSIAYPGGWTVSEQRTEEGALFTTFAAPDSGGRVTVSVLPGGPPAIAPSEKTDRVCQGVTVAGLKGTRCVDRRTSTTTTMLEGKAHTYIIATMGEQVSADIYQRFVDSFAAK